MRIIVKMIIGLYLGMATLSGAVLTEYSNANQDNSVNLGFVNGGQSFTLSSSATVTDIILYEGNTTGNGSEDFALYNSTDCTGGALTTCTMTWNSSTNNPMTCNLAVAQTLSTGTYSFCQTTDITGFHVFRDTSAASYTGGTFIASNTPFPDDLTFQILGTFTGGSANAPFTPFALLALLGSVGLIGFFSRRFIYNAIL